MAKIVRTYSAGVFYIPGDIENRSVDGKRGILKNARRLWYWKGASSLSQLAVDGPQCPKECKFPTPVDEIEVSEIIEVLNVTDVASKIIEAVEIWKQ
jgi:hypothetical protein